MRKHLICISAAAIVALAAGCGGDDTSGVNHETTSASAGDSVDQSTHNDQDIAFAQAMIPHHQQAVGMAKMAAEKATDPKVKDLARRIDGAQGPEIQRLTDLLDRWGAPLPAESEMPGMDHGDTGHGDGMMTDDQMRQLEQASGADFDRMWTQMMIAHHEGAVTMATTEVEQGRDAGATKLAQEIVDAQQAEISEMREMLA